MLERVSFVAGPGPGAAPLEVTPAAVTVLVGPNNCGKSLALREIETLLTEARSPAKPRLVVRDAVYANPPAGADARAVFEPYITEESPAHVRCVNPMRPTALGEVILPHESFAQLPIANFQSWSYMLGRLDAVRLDGPSRLNLVNRQAAQDFTTSPRNHLMRLFQDDAARQQLRELVHDAFGLFLVVDPTLASHLRLRLAERPPSDSAEEQSLDQRARAYHGAAKHIEEFSDGVRAYTGILSALASLAAKTLLIDEPDAFLHPPLARKLGYNIARLSAERHARVIAATHSSEFLMGCIESGAEVEIVRLTYLKGVAAARHLPASSVKLLSREPLTRSANVLAALFHEGAVVTESDNDRAFYQEINHRLVAQKEGAASCLFLNAQNKQTVQRIIQPLRNLGIPAAGIVDIDVLKEGGVVWGHFLDAGNVPEVTRKGLEIVRAHLASRSKDAWKELKRCGTIALSADDKSACEDLFRQLAVYGLFVAPVGELERWLPDLGVAGKAPDWLVAMLDRLGSDPKAADYVVPSAGDVWDFVRGVATWLADPLRKGMPS